MGRKCSLPLSGWTSFTPSTQTDSFFFSLLLSGSWIHNRFTFYVASHPCPVCVTCSPSIHRASTPAHIQFPTVMSRPTNLPTRTCAARFSTRHGDGAALGPAESSFLPLLFIHTWWISVRDY